MQHMLRMATRLEFQHPTGESIALFVDFLTNPILIMIRKLVQLSGYVSYIVDRGGKTLYKPSLRKILPCHLLDLQKEPPLLKACQRGFNWSLQKSIQSCLHWDFEPRSPDWLAEMVTITPCRSTLLQAYLYKS